MKMLTELFLEELADMYDAEQRLVKALPKMAKAATCTHLQTAILSHLEETKRHVTKVEEVFETFGKPPKGQKCEATIGLLEEGSEIASDFEGSPAINAALICAAQKVEHYEIASYGCLHQWAVVLGNEEAAEILAEILVEEKSADTALTALAMSKNQEAAGASSGEDQRDGEEATRFADRGIRHTAVRRR